MIEPFIFKAYSHPFDLNGYVPFLFLYRAPWKMERNLTAVYLEENLLYLPLEWDKSLKDGNKDC